MIIEGWSVFLGLVAGVVVQVAAQWVDRWRNQGYAKRLLKVEIELNLDILSDLQKEIVRIKDLAAAQGLGEHDHYVNMRLFSYNAATALINHGWFHRILNKQSIRSIYEFMSFYNQENANFIFGRFRQLREDNDYPQIVKDCAFCIERGERSRASMQDVIKIL